MKCTECRHSRRFAEDAVMCVHYGMIIRADHECEREGHEARDEDEDQRGEGRDEAEVHGGGQGAA